MNINIRKSVSAGKWYPRDSKKLKKLIDEFISRVDLDRRAVPTPPSGVKALIVPHYSYEFAGQCAAYGYSLIKGKSFKRVILLAPSHIADFNGVCVSQASHYETPLGRIEIDRPACAALLEKKERFGYYPAADTQEYTLENQLPFLQTILSDFKIVPLIVDKIDDPAVIASDLLDIVDRQTLIVVSSDFTHFGTGFGYMPFADDIRENIHKLDKMAIREIVNISPAGLGDYLVATGANICGHNPILILLNMLDKKDKGMLLHYANSGDPVNFYQECITFVAIGFTST